MSRVCYLYFVYIVFILSWFNLVQHAVAIDEKVGEVDNDFCKIHTLGCGKNIYGIAISKLIRSLSFARPNICHVFKL